MGSDGTTAVIRRWLLGVLILGLVGTATELMLMSHYAGAWQLVPLVLIGTALGLVGWHLAQPGAASLRALRRVMWVFLVAGAAGIVLHYRGNLEFQLEFDPAQSRWALFWKVMRAKAPPALAPGVMAQLGLLGLIYAYRHPAADRAQDDSTTGD